MTRKMAGNSAMLMEADRARSHQALMSRKGKTPKKSDPTNHPTGDQNTMSIRLQGPNGKSKGITSRRGMKAMTIADVGLVRQQYTAIARRTRTDGSTVTYSGTSRSS